MFFAALVLSSSVLAPPRPALRFALPPRPLRSECEYGGQVESQRGIYEGLNSAFDFERLKVPAPLPATPSDVQRRPACAGARARTRAESRLHAPLERPCERRRHGVFVRTWRLRPRVDLPARILLTRLSRLGLGIAGDRYAAAVCRRGDAARVSKLKELLPGTRPAPAPPLRETNHSVRPEQGTRTLGCACAPLWLLSAATWSLP
jgi:hypothetical protein